MSHRDRDLSRDFLDDDPLLTPEEVAGLLRVATRSVGRWVAEGRIPPLPDGRPGAIRTPGGHYRIRTSIVRRIADGTISPGGE